MVQFCLTHLLFTLKPAAAKTYSIYNVMMNVIGSKDFYIFGFNAFSEAQFWGRMSFSYSKFETPGAKY